MKNKLFALIIPLLLIWCVLSGNALAYGYSEYFDDDSFALWELVQKTGSTIERTTEGKVRISLSANSTDAFIQAKEATDGTGGFALEADMSLTTEAGAALISLRDTGTSNLEIISISDNKINYFPSANNGPVATEAAVVGRVYRIRAEFRPQGSGYRAVLYCFDSESNTYVRKATLSGLGTAAESYCNKFLWNSFKTRLYLGHGVVSSAEFDNVKLLRLDWQYAEKNYGTADRLSDDHYTISLPANGADAFLQTTESINAGAGFAAAADISMKQKAGFASFGLRDATNTAQGSIGHTLSFVEINGGEIKYLPTLLGSATPKDTVSDGEVCRLQVVYRSDSDKITVYRNGIKKAEYSGVLSILPAFDMNAIFQRSYLSADKEAATSVEFDNVMLQTADSRAYCCFAPESRLTTTDIEGIVRFQEVVNGAENDLCLVLAKYSGGKLSEVRFGTEKTMGEDALKYMSVTYPKNSVSDNDEIRLFAIGGIDTLVPISKSIVCSLQQKEYNTLTYPSADEIQARYLGSRPRVIANESNFKNAKTCLNYSFLPTDEWYDMMIRHVNRDIMASSLPSYKDSDSLRLSASAGILDSMKYLALVYRLPISDEDNKTRTGDNFYRGKEVYKQRMWDILNTAAGWSDWGPGHFLNTSEMCLAYAIAYDWMYDEWTPAERKIIGDALWNKGLQVALNAYANSDYWTEYYGNWVAVCNGGVIAGAAALMGDYPNCDIVIQKAMAHLTNFYAKVAPDGGYYEGPFYWSYATDFWSMMMATVQNTFGTDFGHLKAPGMEQTVLYPIYISGKINLFNHSDNSRSNFNEYEYSTNFNSLYYFAKAYSNRELGRFRTYQIQTTSPGYVWVTPSDLLWFSTNYNSTSISLPENNMYFSNIETAVLRNGLAGNTNSASALFGKMDNSGHGHLDAGNFFYETGGTRWALDLGGESYGLHRIFELSGVQNRWCYYRNRAEGHNTWVINPDSDADQEPNAQAKIVSKKLDGSENWAILNLTAPYAADVNTMRRGIYYNSTDNSLIIRDEIGLKASSELYWFMHTQADIEVSADGKSAILSYDGKRLWVGITEGSGQLSVMAAQPLATSPNPNDWSGNVSVDQNANSGVRKLTVHYTNSGQTVNQTVYMVPLSNGQTQPATIPNVGSLDSWK